MITLLSTIFAFGTLIHAVLPMQSSQPSAVGAIEPTNVITPQRFSTTSSLQPKLVGNIATSSNQLQILEKTLPKKEIILFATTTNTITKPEPILPTLSKPSTPVAPKKPPAQQCNPNYSGCLKVNAGDYDCLGGSGDGPNYTGTVHVLGYDEYGLDRDHDGWGCE